MGLFSADTATHSALLFVCFLLAHATMTSRPYAAARVNLLTELRGAKDDVLPALADGRLGQIVRS